MFSYDVAGNLLITAAKDRLHDATGTGALTDPGGDQPKGRASYTAYWYDGVNRLTSTAEYGAQTSTFSRPDPDVPPTRSDDVLVTSTEYNARGEAAAAYDEYGRKTWQQFDDLGRPVKAVSNYTDGDPATGMPDDDVTLEYTYGTGSGVQIATITSKDRKGAVALVAPKCGDCLIGAAKKSGELRPFLAKNGGTLVNGFDRPRLAAKWSW